MKRTSVASRVGAIAVVGFVGCLTPRAFAADKGDDNAQIQELPLRAVPEKTVPKVPPPPTKEEASGTSKTPAVQTGTTPPPAPAGALAPVRKADVGKLPGVPAAAGTGSAGGAPSVPPPVISPAADKTATGSKATSGSSDADGASAAKGTSQGEVSTAGGQAGPPAGIKAKFGKANVLPEMEAFGSASGKAAPASAGRPAGVAFGAASGKAGKATSRLHDVWKEFQAVDATKAANAAAAKDGAKTAADEEEEGVRELLGLMGNTEAGKLTGKELREALRTAAQQEQETTARDFLGFLGHPDAAKLNGGQLRDALGFAGKVTAFGGELNGRVWGDRAARGDQAVIDGIAMGTFGVRDGRGLTGNDLLGAIADAHRLGVDPSPGFIDDWKGTRDGHMSVSDFINTYGFGSGRGHLGSGTGSSGGSTSPSGSGSAGGGTAGLGSGAGGLGGSAPGSLGGSAPGSISSIASAFAAGAAMGSAASGAGAGTSGGTSGGSGTQGQGSGSSGVGGFGFGGAPSDGGGGETGGGGTEGGVTAFGPDDGSTVVGTAGGMTTMTVTHNTDGSIDVTSTDYDSSGNQAGQQTDHCVYNPQTGRYESTTEGSSFYLTSDPPSDGTYVATNTEEGENGTSGTAVKPEDSQSTGDTTTGDDDGKTDTAGGEPPDDDDDETGLRAEAATPRKEVTAAQITAMMRRRGAGGDPAPGGDSSVVHTGIVLTDLCLGDIMVARAKARGGADPLPPGADDGGGGTGGKIGPPPRPVQPVPDASPTGSFTPNLPTVPHGSGQGGVDPRSGSTGEGATGSPQQEP